MVVVVAVAIIFVFRLVSFVSLRNAIDNLLTISLFLSSIVSTLFLSTKPRIDHHGICHHVSRKSILHTHYNDEHVFVCDSCLHGVHLTAACAAYLPHHCLPRLHRRHHIWLMLLNHSFFLVACANSTFSFFVYIRAL